MTQPLSGIVAEHIRAVNAFDTNAIVATFAIRRWVEKEMVGDHVTLEVREVLDHYGDTIVRGTYEGEYDKTDLPKELILSNYFKVRNGKIVSLVIIFNQPSPY